MQAGQVGAFALEKWAHERVEREGYRLALLMPLKNNAIIACDIQEQTSPGWSSAVAFATYRSASVISAVENLE